MIIFALCSAVILTACSVLTYLCSGKTDLEKQAEWYSRDDHHSGSDYRQSLPAGQTGGSGFGGVVKFTASFMIINMLMNSSMILRILALLVYYGALLLYGTVLWKKN